MKCPVCKIESLEIKEVEPHLFADVCTRCDGKWITGENYEQWLRNHTGKRVEIPAGGFEISITSFELARLCPKDGRILIKYDIARNIPFRIDRCGGCGGTWLDRNEWGILKSLNLHDELKNIFTDQWQEDVHRAEMRQNLENIYRDKFGDEDYEVIREFKSWIDRNEQKNEILAYLTDPDPLQF